MTYYEHSGKFSIFGLISAVVIGSSLAAILGALYAYLKLWIRLDIISIFGAIGFGAIVGYVTGKRLTRGNVRNSPVAVSAGAISGLVGVFVSWAVWLNARRLPADSASSFIWIFDAIVVVTPAIALVLAAVDHPFCESCGRWCETLRSAAMLSNSDATEFRRQVESHNFDFLARLGTKEPDALAWIRLDVSTCTRCHVTNAISAYRVKLRYKNGKRSEVTSRVLRWLIISPGEADALQRVAQRMRASA